MRRTHVRWEAYVRRFEDALDRYKQRRLTAEEARELLGLSGRHFRRQCARFEENGIEGLRDKRLGRVSERRAPESELERMRRLYREEYADFTVQHFHEELHTRHGYHFGYTVTRLALQPAGLVKPAPRRGKHRKKRVRRPMPGMMLFQDGSTHRWIGTLGHDLDLVVTLDDNALSAACWPGLRICSDCLPRTGNSAPFWVNPPSPVIWPERLGLVERVFFGTPTRCRTKWAPWVDGRHVTDRYLFGFLPGGSAGGATGWGTSSPSSRLVGMNLRLPQTNPPISTTTATT